MEIIEVLQKFWGPAVLAFSLTVLFAYLAIKLFPKLKLIDRPHKYGLKRKPIPYYGGLIIFLVFLICVFVFLPVTKALIGLVVAAFLIVLIGFLDDLLDLNPIVRLAFQVFASLILVFSGIGILSINIPFLGILRLDYPVYNGIIVFSAIFTVIWILAIVNTMNAVDGIGGLSSGVGFIAGLTIFFLSIHPDLHQNPDSQQGVAALALIVSMISLGFLLFDFPRPKILMGDTGSTFLGFIIATLAIFSGGKVATAFLVLGIPILDMVWVVLRRVVTGKKFWKGDLKHLHHRLLKIGLSERQVVLMYLLITVILGMTASILVSSRQKFFMLIAVVFFMLLLAFSLVFLKKKK